MQTTDIVSFIQENLNSTNQKITLSVAILSNTEGIVAHKTMLSAIEAIKKCLSEKYYCEILININNGNNNTIQYFQRYYKLNNVKVFKTNHQNIGLSKNFLVEKSRGQFVAFIKSGNLISSNFLLETIHILKKAKGPSIIHTEATLEFGAQQTCTLITHQSSTTPIATIHYLLNNNHWSQESVSTKSTLKQHPFPSNTPEYIDNDYYYSLLTSQHNIKHIVAPKTIVFKRKTPSSQKQSSNFIPYMELLNPLTFKKHKAKSNPIATNSTPNKPLAQKNTPTLNDEIVSYNNTIPTRQNSILHKLLSIFKKSHTTETIVEAKPIEPIKTIEPITSSPTIPHFVQSAWEDINKIETQLYPHLWILNTTTIKPDNDNTVITDIYYQLVKGITKNPNYIFIIPWLIRGGGDKAILNYAHALSEIHPDWHFTFIATEPNTNSVWAKKIPTSADFIEFGKLCHSIDQHARDILMTLLISQLNCKKIHIINSEYGYIWAKHHKSLIQDGYQLYVSIFAAEYFPGTNCKCTFSYEDPYLSDIIDVTTKVFSDNQAMIKRMIEREGFSNLQQLKVHYQPISFRQLQPAKTTFIEQGKLHIMWAGRIVPIKLPNLVASIAKRLNADKYIFDIYGEINDINPHIFDGIQNINYHGSFDSFDSLPTDTADLFLYTSMSDGMPNTILEASAAGLPIIASNDGGVSEFIINQKTGILIDDIYNPNAYVKAITSIKDIDSLTRYVKNAQMLLQTKHSWSTFIQNVEQDIMSDKQLP